jgi:SAM-dependent methyltransferase
MSRETGVVIEPFAVPTRFLEEDGPLPSQHPVLREWLAATARLIERGELPREAVTRFWRERGPEYLRGCLQGHALAKPYGYAGDFEMMDRIYSGQISSDHRFRNWDVFFQAQPAAVAVRNRAPYLAACLSHTHARVGGRPLHVLDLGCGPAHHLAPWLHANPGVRMEVSCVDNDPRALSRAAEVCHDARVHFVRGNAVRFHPEGPYDLIWSSGLFDYVSDRAFVRLVRRLRAALGGDGELVVGNFDVANPSRTYMELVTDWYLHHRSSTDLLRISLLAGADADAVYVGHEATGVNLFLHVRSWCRAESREVF